MWQVGKEVVEKKLEDFEDEVKRCAGVPEDRHRGSPLCDKSPLGLPKPTNEQLCATWRTADLRDTKCKSIPLGGGILV